MLNLPVAMKRLLLTVFSLFWALIPFRPLGEQIIIDSPTPGQALQGQVTIRGTTTLDGFESYSVSFAYQQDPTNTWFPLNESKQAVNAGELATWDTTTITDGSYRVRVMVFLSGGRAVQTVISGLRVRNYTPIETSTPAPEVTQSGALVTGTAADYIPAGMTPTVVEDNPARIAPFDLTDSLLKGGLIALALFILLGLYLGLRALVRRF